MHHALAAALLLATATALPAATLIVEAESGTYTGTVDRHSCWHNVMLTDAPHSTHSGKGAVDTENKIGSHVEVDCPTAVAGPHRITVRYTHTKPDPRPAQLLINGTPAATLALPQTVALPAWKTDSVIVDLPRGNNILRLAALNDGGLPNTDCIKVTDLAPPANASELPRIQILEAEDGRYTGIVDHHSCWNFIAQHDGPHSGFTGEGLVDTKNETGSHIEVTFDAPAPGPYTLGVRYVHGKPDTRPAEVRVNGAVAHPALDFASTRTWTDWTTVTTPVTLRPGRNVIRLTALSPEGLCNTDHFALTPAEGVKP